MKKNDGGQDIQAFPGMEYDATAGQRYHSGMTLRDYFAGQALVGYLSKGEKEFVEVPGRTAVYCYNIADELLKERGKADE